MYGWCTCTLQRSLADVVVLCCTISQCQGGRRTPGYKSTVRTTTLSDWSLEKTQSVFVLHLIWSKKSLFQYVWIHLTAGNVSKNVNQYLSELSRLSTIQYCPNISHPPTPPGTPTSLTCSMNSQSYSLVQFKLIYPADVQVNPLKYW